MTMGDRIAVMHNGVLEQDGDPASLYEAPANRFVASFIGSPGMSFVETAASRVNGVYRLNRASEASGAREPAPTTLVGPRLKECGSGGSGRISSGRSKAS
jgi:multiple sugar transport system ATP-binding protein